jgi:hypothetical protein
MARGGDGRDLDALTDRLRSLPIDIVYPYISHMFPHNVSQIFNSTQGSKTRKIQIQERIKIRDIDKIYTYIVNIAIVLGENS